MIAEALKAFVQYAAETINPMHPRDPALARMFGLGSGTFSGVDVTHDKVSALPAIFRGVSIVSNGLAKIPFYVFKEMKDGHTWDKTHPSWTAVSRKPHPDITAGRFRLSMTSWAMLWGNSYAYIDRPYWPEGPVRLIPMLPDRTFPYRVSRSGNVTNDLEDSEGMLRYATRVGNETRTVDSSEVIHLRGLGPNPYIGWDIVELLKETFGGALAAQEFGNRFFGKGANPAGFIEMAGGLDEEAEERMVASLKKASQGLGKAHQWAILEEGTKFHQLTIDPEKAQFLEGKQFDVRLLAMAIGVKVHKLIDGANSSYSSLEQANQEHKDDDLIPWVGRWREECEDKLLTEDQKESGSHSIDVDDEAMAWVPFREKVSGTVELYNNGLIDQDEGRRKVNFGPAKSDRAKEFKTPANIVFVDDVSAAADAALQLQLNPPEPPMPPGDDEPEDETPDDESEETEPDGRFAEVATAYLTRIAVRLGKTANAKAAKGSKEFIEWCDSLTTEEGPVSLQVVIDELYSHIKSSCDQCTIIANSNEQLKTEVSNYSKQFTSVAKNLVERVLLCTN